MATKHEAAGWTYYTWDVDESLRRIETPDTTLQSKYNSRMQRVWKSDGGEGEWLVYDSQKLIAQAGDDSACSAATTSPKAAAYTARW